MLTVFTGEEALAAGRFGYVSQLELVNLFNKWLRDYVGPDAIKDEVVRLRDHLCEERETT